MEENEVTENEVTVIQALIDKFDEGKFFEEKIEILRFLNCLFNYESLGVVFFFTAKHGTLKKNFFPHLSEEEKSILFMKIKKIKIVDTNFEKIYKYMWNLYENNENEIKINSNISSNSSNNNSNISNNNINNNEKIDKESDKNKGKSETFVTKPTFLKIQKKFENIISIIEKFNEKEWLEFIKDKINEDPSQTYFSIGIFDDGKLKENTDNLLQIKDDIVLKFINIYLKISILFKKNQISSIKFIFTSFLKSKKIDDQTIDLVLSPLEINRSVIADFLLNKNKDNKIILDIDKLNIKKNSLVQNYLIYCYDKIYNFLNENQKTQLIFIIFVNLKNEKDEKIINNLLFYKNFYNCKIISLNDLISLQIKDNYIFYGVNSNITNFKCQIKDDLSKSLLDVADTEYCEKIVKNLQKHFKLGEEQYYKLSKSKNFSYLFDFIELMNFYKNLKLEPGQLTDNLKKIEKKLLHDFKTSKMVMEDNIEILSKCSNTIVNKKQIDTMEELENTIKREMSGKISKKIKFKIVPFGSIVQYLGKLSSDLDLAIILETEILYEIKNFWNDLDDIIYYKIDKNKKFLLSKRLLTITFELNGVKIDLNYFGICGILNSSLIRYYSMIDTRFPILVLNIKEMVKNLKMDDNKSFLNSFSWVMMLVTFLQDYTYPPVLPKLMKNSSFIKKTIQIFNIEQKIHKNKKEQFKDICDNKKLKSEDYYLIKFPLDHNEEFMKIKKSNSLNTQSVAELFVKFIEFLAYIFKHDSLYFDSTLQEIRDKNKIEDKYLNLLNNNHRNKNIELEKKNYFFVIDPFDHTYNPAKGLSIKKKAEEFFRKLRLLHKNMIETGEFYVENQYENEGEN